MNAIVFAAGTGTRLKPFTDRHPKALAPVGGKPMLEHVLLKLKNAGISRVAINVHHFAPQITEFLAAHDNFGMSIRISDESDRLLDTGGGLLKALPLLDDGADNEPTLLHNADILTDMPTGEMLARHMETGADATLLATERESSRRIYFSAEGKLCGWHNIKSGESRPDGFTPADGMRQTAFGGVHIVQPATIMPLLREYAGTHGDVFSIIPFYLANLRRMDIAGFTPSSAFMWHDIGSPEKLAAANDALHKK